MDSEALRTFVTIRDLGSFSAAADALGRSQPAISRRIALLEQDLGVPLFDRGVSPLALTAAGRTLLPHAERALADLREAREAIRALRTDDAGPVALASVGTLAGAPLTAVLRRFAKACPRAELSIGTATSAEVSNLVRRGEAAIGLRYLLDPTPDIASVLVGAETLCVVCAADHPRAGRSVASLAVLRGESWFAFADAWRLRASFADNIFAQFEAAGTGVIRWTAVDSQTAQKRLIEAGFGIALLPRSAIEEELRDGSLATIAVRDLKARNPVYAITRQAGYLSPAAAKLFDLLTSGLDIDRARKRAGR